MQLSEIVPYLHEYVKTNYFTAILVILLICVAGFKHLPFRIASSRKNHFTDKHAVPVFENPLFIICLVGFALRVGWLLICQYRPAFDWIDAVQNLYALTECDKINIYAKAITKGVWFIDAQGFPTVARPIGYPVFLSFFYFILGAKLWVLYVANLMLVISTIILLHRIGTYMFGERVGVLAAFLMAIYPLSIYTVSLPLDEHLFLPLWYFGLYLLLREIRGKSLRFAALWYGLIFGYATMTRTHSVFMPLVVGFVYFRLRRPLKFVILSVLTVYLIGQTLTIPWVNRNYNIWKTYIPYSASWRDLYSGLNASVKQGDDNGRWPAPGEPGYSEEFAKAVAARDLGKREAVAKRETIRWVTSHPKDFLILGIEKGLHFMGANRKRGVWAIDLISESTKLKPEMQLAKPVETIAEESAFGAYYVLLYSFLIGVLWVMLRWKSTGQIQRISLSMVGLCLLFYLGEHLFIYPERKYRFPLEPLMLVVVSGYWSYLWYDFRIRTGWRKPTGL